MLRSQLIRNDVKITGLVIFSAIMIIGGFVLAAEPEVGSPEQAKEDTYPLETCIVSGEKLGSMGTPFIYEHEGREIRFCCKGCVGGFQKDPAGYLKKMDEAIIAGEVPDYPLDTCVVSGDTLGTMGDPVDRVYDNRLARLCCAGCIHKFEKQPDQYMKIIDEARAARAAEQSPRPYPLDTCIVSGGKLGAMGEPVTYVYEGQEILFCCAGCVPQFEKNPEKYMKKLISLEADKTGE
ncbi:MAG: YHS domain-containing protein [Candidatus Eisenbacteria bacterium]